MTTAYTMEKMYRTIEQLTYDYDNLPRRLSTAYDHGLGTIATKEIAHFGNDIQNDFASIKDRMEAVKGDGSWSAASIQEMTDQEILKIAKDIGDLFARASDALQIKEEIRK